jgi:hypothetical protein
MFVASLVPQRDQRIDFGCASCRDVAREQRGEDHTKRHGAKCNRISRRNFKQQSVIRRVNANAPASPIVRPIATSNIPLLRISFNTSRHCAPRRSEHQSRACVESRNKPSLHRCRQLPAPMQCPRRCRTAVPKLVIARSCSPTTWSQA